MFSFVKQLLTDPRTAWSRAAPDSPGDAPAPLKYLLTLCALPALMAGAFMMQFFVQGAWGVIPAHITELSPNAVRGFLPGFGYQCGAALAGGVPYVEARLAEHLSYPWAMALSAATVFVLAAAVAWLGPERRGVAFGRGAP